MYSFSPLLDHSLTQAAVSRFALFIGYRNGTVNLINKNTIHGEHQPPVAGSLSYRGLCEPGDLQLHYRLVLRQTGLPG